MTSMVTWNMQGAKGNAEDKWKKLVKQLVNNFDVVCLQECGEIAPSIKRETPQPPQNAWPQWLRVPPQNLRVDYVKWNLDSETRPQTAYILWAEQDPRGHRVNLAICSKIQPSGLLYADPGLPNGRPSIGMQVGPDNVYTLHGFSGNGNDTPGLVTNISGGPAPWYALGDYNREPQVWTPPAGTLCPPNRPTHNQEKYDYMVWWTNQTRDGDVQQGGSWSDHLYTAY